MEREKINQFILHYLKEDKTQSAIMLTGAWGTGKSYYVNHELATYIHSSGFQCLVISLYGLNSIDEISKSIYWGLLTIKLKIKDNKKNAGVVMTKTIIKNIAGHYGVDLSASDKDLKSLYKSIDLKNKLIVLEDVERTEIDLFQLLGYINNLVEHDNVKILLVANEDEIIERKPVEEKRNMQKSVYYEYTEKTKRYLTVKEKSINDTIQFDGNYPEAVESIIRIYENKKLTSFCRKSEIQNIIDIMRMYKNYNLRAFLFACQKTVDIYNAIQIDVTEDMYKCIFYSVLSYSLRIKKGIVLEWKDSDIYSFDLGTGKYPLFRFCYDFILYHELDISKIVAADEELKKLRLYDKGKTQQDEDIFVLSHYYCEYEEKVRTAVGSIMSRLRNVNDISFYDYGRIAAYLIIIKHNLDIDISDAKKLLVNNLQGRGDEINADALFRVSLRSETEDIKREFDEIQKAMYKALSKDEIIPGFQYLPNQSEIFYDYVCKNEVVFHGKEKFAALMDIPKMIKMFSDSSPDEMNDIRLAFWAMYRPDNIKAIFKQDKPYLQELQSGIKTYFESEKGDKIQKMQANWFVQNLEEFIEKL